MVLAPLILAPYTVSPKLLLNHIHQILSQLMIMLTARLFELVFLPLNGQVLSQLIIMLTARLFGLAFLPPKWSSVTYSLRSKTYEESRK